MDDRTYENWLRIKEEMEKSGNTNNMYYKRACVIERTRKDPLDNFLNG